MTTIIFAKRGRDRDRENEAFATGWQAFYSKSYRRIPMAARGRPRLFDRQQALQSAVDVFLARGYDGATLEDLTAAMGGIAPPSFYAAFESKEHLFREAIELYASTAGRPGREALDGPKVRDAIEGLLRESTNVFSVPNRPGGCLVLLGGVSCTRANAETREFVDAIRQQPPVLIRKRLERAIDEGELPESADVETIASFYVTVLHGLALRARNGAPREALHAAIDGAMAAWKMLTAPAKSPKSPKAPNSPKPTKRAKARGRGRR
jgi:AcrR family transcriptional regulator